ncbi:single-stranded DNA-binding protein [Actinomadura violacea]|uniref:Single-stranded DNA-binding protein n=1 Tax=Actinomadura violacea TaxID=2819934 RepID=A0ABS3RY49_9ACTN|nr:single-stranded DNA-binding protein [Actinomadura violacea]MBO2461571.1 single-stranded DNA-binding protein [Actinomadura violacea]
MAGDTTLTIVGNLARDPDLKFTSSGVAKADFTVASTPRFYKDGEWKDGETLWMRCTAWKRQAENAAETLRQGMRVIVTGRLKQRSYETREGEKRTVFELEAEEIGPSLRSATAKVDRARRDSPSQPADDPWANTPAGGSDDPPF